jgi:predicted nucleotidyltransferase
MTPELKQQLADFVQALKSAWGDDLVSVVLFGSQVSGTAMPESDIDVLIVKKGFPASRLARRDELHALDDQFPEGLRYKLSTILLTSEEASDTKPYYLDMTVDCELLYDRGSFFEGVLNRLKNRLKELGSQRVFDPDGYPYWILKPDARLGEEIIL